MNQDMRARVQQLLDTVGIEEMPMGLFFTDTEPESGFAPEPAELPTREKEINNQVDWQAVFSRFSCVMGNIWRARKKHTAAYFSAQRFGCPGGAFWLGFNKPQAEAIINYVSTGIEGWTEGELYCDSADTLRRIFETIDPRPAPRPFCVVKPVDTFATGEVPETVTFFTRPESLCGLHQLAAFVTSDPEVVVSPWSAACGGLAVWPAYYAQRGLIKAVVGGWDPSARKFFKTDELSFSVPYPMFTEMTKRFDTSFLTTKTWSTVRKKIERSKKAWGEDKEKY